MNDTAQIITAWGTLLSVLGGIVLQIVNTTRSSRRKDRMDRKLDDLHIATNGFNERIANASFAQGDAEGHERGLQQGRDESKG